MEKILLIDGHSILSRAFYGMPMLTTAKGIHTNAVYGFLNIMFKTIDDESADYIAVAFDVDRHTLKRTQLFPEYKGTRKPMPEELHEQIPIIMDVLRAMNIPILSLETYEADDILGTLAKRYMHEMEVTVLSGDRDLLQLADEHIKISVPKTSKGRTEVHNYYPADVLEEYKVTPLEFIDMKALMGDTSDNIPGVEGIGEKTAGAIISAYHSIENAYAHCDELKPPRASRNLKEHYDMAVLSKQLATIDTNVPLDFDFRKASVKLIYTAEALKLCREYEFRSLIRRFADADNGTDASENAAEGRSISIEHMKPVTDPFMAGIIYRDAAEEKLVGINICCGKPVYTAGEVSAEKTAALKNATGNAAGEISGAAREAAVTETGCAPEAETVGATTEMISDRKCLCTAVSICLSDERLYVIRAGEEYPAEKLTADINALFDKLISKKVCIASVNFKDQLKCLDVQANSCVDDLALGMYLLDPLRSVYDYDDLSRDFLGVTLKSRMELVGRKALSDIFSGKDTGMSYAESEGEGGQLSLIAAPAKGSAENDKLLDAAAQVMAYLAYIPFLARKSVLKKLEEKGMLALYSDVELPLIYSLNDMENAGIRVDSGALKAYAEVLGREIAEKEQEIYRLAGEEFNINSPAQLGRILFEKLGIKGGKKTKTGYSTAADVLSKLADEHPVVEQILRYRTITKLYSTYAAGLSAFISDDGRIHGTFNQTVTATGRISSTDPNLQNIPVRTAEGREIRRVFIPADGCVFVDADYSQVELRILAAFSEDEKLINAYRDAMDVHTITASEVFHVPVEQVTKEMRKNAKAVNFGIVYGISAFGLGEGLSIGRKEAQMYIEKYFETYPGVKRYLDSMVEKAHRDGYVATAFGRIRPIPDINVSNFQKRSFSERVAMNSPVQGTAADIMKIAMNRVNRHLAGFDDNGERTGKVFRSRIVLQVHDELLIEAVPEELEEVMELVKRDMENAADLKVRLNAEVGSGSSWDECH